MEIKLTKIFFAYRRKLLLSIMRTFIFLFCATTFGLATNSALSQNVKISIDTDKVVSVDEVFDLIMSQTDYKFIYQIDIFKDFPSITLKKGNIKINELLATSLINGDFIFELTEENTIVIRKNSVSLSLQENIVKGTVTDVNGLPLAGMSIYLTKDPSGGSEDIIRGTTTDFNGSYSLKASTGDILVASGIGYNKSQFVINANQTVYDFVLTENINELEEVIITGYQTISKERATGTYTTIAKATIEENVNSNIGSVLQGVVPGLQLVEDSDGEIDINDVIIRGVGSIDPESSTAPLLVVDGYPVEGGFSTINPNDVESITVLKDAAAASIWGARAGNGVIVIVTKKANQGDDLKVTFSSFVKMREKIDLDKNITRANSETTLAYESTIWTDNGPGLSSPFILPYSPPNDFGDLGNVNRGGNTSYSHGARAYHDAYYGDITQAELFSRINRLKQINSFDDAEKYLLNSPVQTSYNLTLSNAGKKSNTRVSAVFYDTKSNFINDKNDQLLINFNNTYKVKDWVTFNLNAMFDSSTSENSGLGLGTIQNMAPYENLINSNGTFANVRGRFDPQFMKFLGNNTVGLPYDDVTYNPLRDANENKFSTKQTNFRINPELIFNIMKGLTFKAGYQYEKFKSDNETYYGENSSYAVNEFLNGIDKSTFNLSTGTIGESYIPYGAIYRASNSETVASTLRGVLSFDRTFNKHSVTALAGIERISRTTYGQGGSLTYGYNKETNQFDNMIERPTWVPLFSTTTSQSGVPDGRFFSQTDRRYDSYFANAAYTYNDKYTLSGSVRADGANFIVEDKSMRYNPMWSAGLSWNVTKESFMDNVDFVDYLKLRVTNGENGNLVGSSATSPTISVGASPSFYTQQYYAFLSSLGNPNLRWERINTFNIGADFDLFDKKLYGSIDIYNKHSKELIANVDIASTLGNSSATFNVGEMRNKGVELDLNSKVVSVDDLDWTTTLTFAHNKSEVTSLQDIFIHPRSLGGFPYVEGKPYLPVYAYEYGGMQTIDSQPNPYPTIIGQNGETYGMDENIGSNGEDGRDVLKFMGTQVAPTVLGWNNSVKYKNFTLNTRLIGKFGHVFRRPTFEYNAFAQGGNYHEDLELLLAGQDEQLGLPSISQPQDFYYYRWGWYSAQLSSLVEDADFIRLKQIYISYDFSKQLLKKTGFSNIRLFAQAENLGTIWTANDYNIDPENIAGVSIIPQKTFSLGLNLEF